MLLITRRTGEAIVINGTIEVKVLEVSGGRVKLGFEYPTGSSVYRQELFAKIQEENKAAALSSQQAAGADTALLDKVVGKVVRNLHSLGKGQVGPQTTTQDKPEEDADHDTADHNREPNRHDEVR